MTGPALPPRLADGTELLGEFLDSGYRTPPSLVKRADGQAIQLSRLLYLVACQIDGNRDSAAIAFRQVLGDPADLLLVAGLSFVSAVFHECGHAAGCRYGGARPGRIGVGIYLVWPSFFTNVTDSYRLSRGGRLRTIWAASIST